VKHVVETISDSITLRRTEMRPKNGDCQLGHVVEDEAKRQAE
jgi:peptide methionine sulfoxide reductase MsrB